MTAAQAAQDFPALACANSMLKDELRGFRKLGKTPSEIKRMLSDCAPTKRQKKGRAPTLEEVRALIDLWCELDKCLYFGIKYCDLSDIKVKHEKLRPFIEQKEFDEL